MTTALLLDTSFSSQPIVRALSEHAIDVITVGSKSDDALAMGVCQHITADYSDRESLASIVLQLKPDFIVPGCNDLSYESYCALPRTLFDEPKVIDSESLVARLHNKNLFRGVCRDYEISAPAVFDGPTDVGDSDFPVIVKPVDGFSGKGVSIVEGGGGELLSAIKKAEAASRIGEAVIEQFVEGPLFSYSAFLFRGKICAGFLVREFSFANPFSVDTSFVVGDESLEQKIVHELKGLISALDLQEGLLHAQFIETKAGVCLIEVTRRCPGDLYANLIQLSTGFDYAAAYVSAFLGRAVSPRKPDVSSSAIIVRHTVTADREGYLGEFAFEEPASLMSLTPVLKAGQLIQASQNFRVAVSFFRVQTQADLGHILALAESRNLVSVSSLQK